MFHNKCNTCRAIAVVAMFLLFVVPGLSSQESIDFNSYRDSFGVFAEDVASSLGLNSTIGLNTSEAYIGQLLEVPPSIGVGLTLGASTIPYATMDNLFTDLGMEVPPDLQELEGIGLPFPGAAFDARIGGIIVPFDLGVKYSYMPPALSEQIGEDIDLDYKLAGFDVRIPIVRERILIPSVSVGAGYNYLDSSVTFRNITDVPFEIEIPQEMRDEDMTDYHTIGMSDPDATLSWSSNVIDLKAQASMNLWLLTPYVGMGTSYARSNVGGGLVSQLRGDTTGNGEFNHEFNDQDVEELKQQLRDYNDAGGDIDEEVIDNLSADQGILVESGVNGWSFRVFGGTSVNFLMFRLDMGLGYDLLGKNVSGNVGLRFQL